MAMAYMHVCMHNVHAYNVYLLDTTIITYTTYSCPWGYICAKSGLCMNAFYSYVVDDARKARKRRKRRKLNVVTQKN